MHPNRAFAWEDRDAMLALVGEISFATIAAEGPVVVHAPVLVAGPDRLLFHISRGNRAKLDGRRAIVSVLGPDSYISPDWYGADDQVPTWNYLAVEAEGPLRRLEEAELTELLDGLSAAHEARLWRLAEALVPARGSADWNQALMDLGATICTARAPKCSVCPVQADCRSAGCPRR